MFHPAILAITAISLAATLSLASASSDEAALEGAWVLDSIELPDGEVFENPQRGLVLFADGHFSFTMVAPPDTERGTFTGDEPTESEKAGAFDSYVSGAGAYTIEGDNLVTRAYLHIDPNAMSEWPNRIMEYKIGLEEDVLRWHIYGVVMRFHRISDSSLPH
jgi:hypothetical protein